MTLRHLHRLAGLGALAVAGGVLALYLLVAFASRHTASGGIDWTNAVLAWIGAGIPAAAVMAVHLVYARVLLRASRR